MFIIVISRLRLKLGHVGSKTRSLGQILEKPCVHSRGHSFYLKFRKLGHNANHQFEIGSGWFNFHMLCILCKTLQIRVCSIFEVQACRTRLS